MVFEPKLFVIGRIFHPEPSYECCSVCDTEGSLPFKRYFIALLTGNAEGSEELMVPHGSPEPTLFPTNIIHTPLDNRIVWGKVGVSSPVLNIYTWAANR